MPQKTAVPSNPVPSFTQKNLIALNYNDFEIRLNEDGWFNATVAASHFGKNPNDWLRLPATQEYLEAFERKYGKISYLKTKRGNNGGTWLHPKLAVRFAQWLDIDFALWCDDQIDRLIRGNHPHFDWKRIRHEATSSYKVMNAVLQLVRQNNGKPTQFFHYANEAKLINWAITGEFKPLDRDSLCNEELDLLAKLEERNTVLVGCGLCREERKIALSKFVSDFKTPVMINNSCFTNIAIV